MITPIDPGPSFWQGEFSGATYEREERVVRRAVRRIHSPVPGRVLMDYWSYPEGEKPFVLVARFVDAIERNVRAWQ